MSNKKGYDSSKWGGEPPAGYKYPAPVKGSYGYVQPVKKTKFSTRKYNNTRKKVFGIGNPVMGGEIK